MLKHEPEQTPTAPTAAPIPAAERRVSAEELTRAVSALEEARAAERIAGVAPIGQVVDELGLDSTPEEIWEQVQKQRTEAEPKTRAVPVLQKAKIGRQVRRGWRHSKGWLWVIFWCTGGFGLLAGLPHFLHPASSQAITINGDSGAQTVNAQGKDVIVSGDGNTITLKGKARSVTIDGDSNKIMGESAESAEINGDGDTAQWTEATPAAVRVPKSAHKP